MKWINLIITLFCIAMIGLMLFVSAGAWRLPVVWLYLGIAGALALTSSTSMLSLLVWSVLLVPRTLREEDVLFKELEGYAEYARQVRFRLLPGVW
jgi:protein-S-isoprenylcysteine O-methyltransferase Ste14